MAIKLHRCSATFVKGPHPCWAAQHALDEAGIDYELVKHSPVRFLRSDVKKLTGVQKLPLVEFEDGTFLRDSKVIAQQAQAGTLHGPGESAPLSCRFRRTRRAGRDTGRGLTTPRRSTGLRDSTAARRDLRVSPVWLERW